MTRFPETVEITVRLVRYTGVRFDIVYEMRDAATGALRCLGESSHCFIDGSGAPISVKRKFPAWDALFRRYAEESR